MNERMKWSSDEEEDERGRGSGPHLGDARPCEGHNHRHHIDSQLELQELGDAVIDITPPHHCLHNAAEVVICQDDV